MIALALLIAALTDIDEGKPIVGRSFYVGGWYCTVPGCEASRRHLGAAVKFAGSAEEAGVNKAPRLAKEWTVTLDCEVSGRRLKRCEVQDDSTDLPAAKRIAVKITQSATLALTRSTKTRAIIQVRYNASDCAPWMGCVTELLPPPPPPPSRGS